MLMGGAFRSPDRLVLGPSFLVTGVGCRGDVVVDGGVGLRVVEGKFVGIVMIGKVVGV